MELLLECCALKKGFLGDLTGGASTARMTMAKSSRVAIVVELAAAAVDLNITLKQHDAASAGTTKDLAILSPYYKKVGAATKFTKVVAPEVAQVIDASFNGAAGVIVFDVLGEELDCNGGFNHISAVIAQGAVARIACIEFVAHEAHEEPAYKIDL
jgi:hypothetical protein